MFAGRLRGCAWWTPGQRNAFVAWGSAMSCVTAAVSIAAGSVTAVVRRATLLASALARFRACYAPSGVSRRATGWAVVVARLWESLGQRSVLPPLPARCARERADPPSLAGGVAVPGESAPERAPLAPAPMVVGEGDRGNTPSPSRMEVENVGASRAVPSPEMVRASAVPVSLGEEASGGEACSPPIRADATDTRESRPVVDAGGGSRVEDPNRADRHARVREWLRLQYSGDMWGSAPNFVWKGSEADDESLSFIERGIRKHNEGNTTARLAVRVPGFWREFQLQGERSSPSSTSASS